MNTTDSRGDQERKGGESGDIMAVGPDDDKTTLRMVRRGNPQDIPSMTTAPAWAEVSW